MKNFCKSTYYKNTGELKDLNEEEVEKLRREFDDLSKEEPGFLFHDSDGEPLFYVEDVIGYKKEGGKEFFQVLWLGYREPTWEPKASLKNISIDILENARKKKTFKYTEKQRMITKKIKKN